MHRVLTILSLLLAASPSPAEDLRILTSFPPDVSDTYRALWRQATPDSDVQILNKNTVSGIDEVMRGNKRKFDIFWASSPEAFEILTRSGAFADEKVCGEDGPSPVEPFALSAFGWVRRTDSTLFMPAEWNHLLNPIYRDRISMARPARSGSTHMLVEQLLQLRGWEEGWAFLLELSGNLSTLTARSYGVPDGVVNERFDLGLTIDFLSQARGESLDFRYGRPLMPIAAQIGILKGGAQPDKACDFVRMVLSRDGQLALLAPDVSRVPYDEAIRFEAGDRIPQEMVDALKLPWIKYDAQTSSDRYWAVNMLFDLLVTEKLVKRRGLWRRYHDLEGRVPDHRLREARQLMTTIVVSPEEAREASQLAKGGLRSSMFGGSGYADRRLLRSWRKADDDMLARAEMMLSALERSDSE